MRSHGSSCREDEARAVRRQDVPRRLGRSPETRQPDAARRRGDREHLDRVPALVERALGHQHGEAVPAVEVEQPRRRGDPAVHRDRDGRTGGERPASHLTRDPRRDESDSFRTSANSVSPSSRTWAPPADVDPRVPTARPTSSLCGPTGPSGAHRPPTAPHFAGRSQALRPGRRRRRPGRRRRPV